MIRPTRVSAAPPRRRPRSTASRRRAPARARRRCTRRDLQIVGLVISSPGSSLEAARAEGAQDSGAPASSASEPIHDGGEHGQPADHDQRTRRSSAASRKAAGCEDRRPVERVALLRAVQHDVRTAPCLRSARGSCDGPYAGSDSACLTRLLPQETARRCACSPASTPSTPRRKVDREEGPPDPQARAREGPLLSEAGSGTRSTRFLTDVTVGSSRALMLDWVEAARGGRQRDD